MSDKVFGVWFGVCALLGLGWLGFCVWAIYSIVTWVTAQ